MVYKEMGICKLTLGLGCARFRLKLHIRPDNKGV